MVVVLPEFVIFLKKIFIENYTNWAGSTCTISSAYSTGTPGGFTGGARKFWPDGCTSSSMFWYSGNDSS